LHDYFQGLLEEEQNVIDPDSEVKTVYEEYNNSFTMDVYSS